MKPNEKNIFARSGTSRKQETINNVKAVALESTL